jgi:hypothetical protein
MTMGPNTTLPEPANRYLHARDQRDVDTAIGAFSPDATVTDDGHTYHGTDEIRTWIATAATEYTFTRTLLGAAAVDDHTWEAVCHLAGDFPGGAVDLRYRFTFAGDRITELVIAP